jgi:signal transduction histidine kinase
VRISGENATGLERGELGESNGSARNRGIGTLIRRHWWLVLFIGGDLLLAEWIREPRLAVAAPAVVAWLVVALELGRRRGIGYLAAVMLAAASVTLGAAQYQLDRIGTRWPAVREERITTAADRWLRQLKYARGLVERVVSGAARAEPLGRAVAFDRLDRLVRRERLEVGVVVLEADGTPTAWAGRFRLAPVAQGDSIDFRASPYYAVIEARRHLDNDRTAVASLLLAADSTVADQGRSLARRFEERFGIGVDVLPRGVAPDTSDVFDYLEPTADGGVRLLFSVQLRPPTQAAAHERAFRASALRLVAIAALGLVVALLVAPPGIARFGLAAVPVVVALRAPLGDAIDVPAFFSSRTFFHQLLGPASQAAGPLMMLSAMVAMAAFVWLGRPGIRRWWGAPVAVLLLVAAPYLVSVLGRGVQVPVDGVSAELWIVWQLVVFLVASAILLPAAALLPRRQNGSPVPVVIGASIAAAAAVIGLLIWNARHGWPDWYPLLWAVALGFVIWPGRRAATVAGIGVAVGCAASLMVWGAEIEGRVNAGRADLAALGARADPIAVPLLDAFIDRVDAGAAPRNASELFALWRSSPLSRQAFPVTLGLWTTTGDPRAELRLDDLDLPDSLVARSIREFPVELDRTIVPVQRIPSVHYLAVVRLDPATVLTIGLGPRSSLVPQARLGRLLDPVPPNQPLYRLTLSPTGSLEQPREGASLWSRERWAARGSRTVAMGDGARDVNGVVELGQPRGLLVRGALLVVLDLLVLFALGGLAAWLAAGRVERPRWWPEWRAFRTRIAVALGLFFLLPAAGFAVINIAELANDGRSRRDLMIAQTLRDAAPGGVLPTAGVIQLDRALEILSERVDANLALYQDGRLTGSNGGGVFEDFGVISPLIDPAVFHRVHLDAEPGAVSDGPSAIVPTRIGVRAVRLPTGDAAMLASPQSTGDPDITRQQYDLAYVLALAVVVGLIAAGIGAQFSARALTRPASELREAALAFGRGEPLPETKSDPTTEFEPVFAAIKKMAADVRATQEAQERAARVLAWGEMANQIAHEIKNPLTPMRLGMQHLQRVHRDGRPLGPTLDETARRILGEIDRLDTIARAFSRFAAPAEGRPAPGPTPLGEVAREVVALYGLAPDAGGVSLVVERDALVLAHRDELKETLVNLLENSRNADARSVVVRISGPVLTVEDDGCGITPDELARIFEPRFSTTTSGSGLGLAIVKRLVEGWRAGIDVTSEVGRGTTVTIRFEQPASQ